MAGRAQAGDAVKEPIRAADTTTVEQSQECVVFPCKAHFDASDADEGDTRWCDGPVFSHAQQLGHDGEWRPLPGATRTEDTVRT